MESVKTFYASPLCVIEYIGQDYPGDITSFLLYREPEKMKSLHMNEPCILDRLWGHPLGTSQYMG